MLKADLHIHAKGDPIDIIRYTPKKLIDRAASLNFDVISITNHKKVTYNRELSEYAKKKGILLIPGAEAMIKHRHVLVYNITNKDLSTIKTINDLKMFRKDNYLIIAPHPFFIKKYCLSNLLTENIELFDAIEFSSNYTNHININKKAVMVSRKYNIPMVGTSDAHSFKEFGTDYTLIDAEKNIQSVFKAIRSNKVKVVTKPKTLRKLTMDLSKTIILSTIKKTYRKILK
tara:strand:- start:3381 stop:4070 length:690 start_codon:yes stop_codon:yes gene_type:complete